MGAKSPKLLPKEQKIIEKLGERLKLARLRRKFTAEQVSTRAGISRKTLWHIEKGSSHISIGNILQVLSVLGLAKDLETVAEDDALGRKLQDLNLQVKKRGPKKNK
jgi:transcriptional regulator with XRE-family HTH domain